MRSTERDEGTRAARLIEAAALDPPGMPAGAVLLVRRLQDPRPGTVTADSTRAAVPRIWETAVRAALDREARRAFRPAQDLVPPTANAVLFADRAELLACLARDLVAGAVDTWWWRAFFAASSVRDLSLLVAEWLREPVHLAPSLSYLSHLEAAAAVLDALAPLDVDRLFHQLARHAGLTSLLDESRETRADELSARAAIAPGEDASPGEVVSPARTPMLEVPWSRLVPPGAVDPRLSHDRQILLGVALALVRAPLAARRREFQLAVARWRRESSAVSRGPDPVVLSPRRPGTTIPPGPPSGRRSPGPPAEHEPGVGDRARPPETPHYIRKGHHRGLPRDASRDEGDNASRDARSPSGVPANTTPPTLRLGPDTSELPLRSGPSASERDRSSSPAHPLNAPDRTLEPRAPGSPPPEPPAPRIEVPRPRASEADRAEPVSYGEWVQTGLGGAFFLVTVFERLRLFDLIDSHFAVKSELGSWDWLRLVTHALLDRSVAEYRTDPLWYALDLLSEREPGDPIPVAFAAPACLLLPEEWYPGAAGGRRLRRAIGRGREQLWHPEGFVIEDRLTAAAGPAAPSRRMSRSLARLARVRARASLPPELSSPDLTRFLQFFLPYLRWRLSRALSLGPEQGLVSELLVRRADLSLTRSHVDVRMSLASVRLAVRLAGLDADPGWVPDFGRVVSFTFA